MLSLRGVLLAVFAAALLGDLAVAGWVGSRLVGSDDGEKRKWLVTARNSFTSRYTEDRALLEASPDEARAAGFRFDSPEDVQAWAAGFLPRVPYLVGVSAETLPADPIERAKHLTVRFSRNGRTRGCGAFDGIEPTLLGIASDRGHGCCVDHARAFVALATSYGLVVRTVRHSGHTFNEIWVPALAKWAMFDSQYAVHGTDEAGRPLSTLELRDRMLAGEAVRWTFFGNDFHVFSKRTPESHRYYGDRESFRDFKVVWGTNFLEQEAFHGRLRFLPKPPTEMLARVVGVMPPDLVLVDEAAVAPAASAARRERYLAVLGVLTAGTLVPPLLLPFARRRSRSRAGAGEARDAETVTSGLSGTSP